MCNLRILHLSDIHFGIDKLTDGFSREKRAEILKKLIVFISNLNAINPIDHIMVSGDIAWKGKKEEYEEATIWFSELLETLKIDSNKITFCVGNHDINRRQFIGLEIISEMKTVLELKNEEMLKKIDSLYSYSKVEEHEYMHEDYNTFCDSLDIMPYEYYLENSMESQYSYSVGHKDINGIRIVAFNTAFMSYFKQYEVDNMWLGLSQIKSLEKKGIIKRDTEHRPFTVALFHHAPRYLHPNETAEYSGREATVSYLMEYVDLALCGHTETEALVRPIQYPNGSWLAVAGSTYYADEYKNSFTVYDIDKEKKKIAPKCYQYNFKSSSWGLPEQDYIAPYPILEEHNKSYTLNYQGAKLEIKLINSVQFNETVQRWKFVLYSGDRYFDIKFRVLNKVLKKNTSKSVESINLSNKIDVNRYLNFECDCTVNGNFNVSISYAKPDSVQNALLSHGCYEFLTDTCNDNEIKKFEILNDNNEIVIQGTGLKWDGFKNLEDEKRTLIILDELEKHFDIKFSTQLLENENLSEIQSGVDMLHKIMEQGYYKIFDNEVIDLPTSSLTLMQELFSSHNPENLKLIFACTNLTVKIYNENIWLGNGVVFYWGRIDMNDLDFKINSFKDGDTRNIKFSSGSMSIIALDYYTRNDLNDLKKIIPPVDDNNLMPVKIKEFDMLMSSNAVNVDF